MYGNRRLLRIRQTDFDEAGIIDGCARIRFTLWEKAIDHPLFRLLERPLQRVRIGEQARTGIH